MSPIVRHRAAIVEPVALGQLLRAIEDYSGSPEVSAGLQLLALTFVRPGELRGATWAEIDLDSDLEHFRRTHEKWADRIAFRSPGKLSKS